MSGESSRFTSDRRVSDRASWLSEGDWEAGTAENVDIIEGGLVGRSHLNNGEVPASVVNSMDFYYDYTDDGGTSLDKIGSVDMDLVNGASMGPYDVFDHALELPQHDQPIATNEAFWINNGTVSFGTWCYFDQRGHYDTIVQGGDSEHWDYYWDGSSTSVPYALRVNFDTENEALRALEPWGTDAWYFVAVSLQPDYLDIWTWDIDGNNLIDSGVAQNRNTSDGKLWMYRSQWNSWKAHTMASQSYISKSEWQSVVDETRPS